MPSSEGAHRTTFREDESDGELTDMRDIKAVSLDLDDTLWAVGPVIERAERVVHAWLAQHYPRVGERYSLEAMREVRAGVQSQWPERAHDFTFLRRASFGQCLVASGYDDGAAEAALAVFMQARNEVELFADVLPALADLKANFVVLAVSNGNADLETIGLAHFFDHVVHAAHVGAAKPDAAVFTAAVRASRLEPPQVLHVGDDPEADVIGARRAGLHAIWMNRKGAVWEDPEYQPHAEASDLYDVLRVLGLY